MSTLYCVAFNFTTDGTLDNTGIIGIHGCDIKDTIQTFVGFSTNSNQPKQLVVAIRCFLIQILKHIREEIIPYIGGPYFDCCPELSKIKINEEAMLALRTVYLDILKKEICKLMEEEHDEIVNTHFMEHKDHYALILSLSYDASFIEKNFKIFPLQIFGQTVTKSARKN